MSQKTRLVIGKFNPPHLGYLHLINVGASKLISDSLRTLERKGVKSHLQQKKDL